MSDKIDVDKLIREACWSGLYIQWAEPTGKLDWKPAKVSLTVPVTKEQIEHFARLVMEECAVIARSYEPRCDTCPSGVENAIRARMP